MPSVAGPMMACGSPAKTQDIAGGKIVTLSAPGKGHWAAAMKKQ